MKQLSIICILLFLTIVSNAQNAKSATVEYNKVNAPCVVANYNLPAEVVEDALKKKMDQLKLGSADKSKGFKVYKGVILESISTDKMDYYTKVEGKKGTSTAYIMASKGYDNFANPTDDAKVIENLILFLNNFVTDANAFQLSNDIDAQQKVAEKAQKSYTNAVDDGNSYAKDLEKLQKRIADNKEEQQKLKENAEKEKITLDALKEKLKLMIK